MSKNNAKVKMFYDRQLWNKQKVFDAIGKWIIKEEYTLITGEDYFESEEE